MSQVYREMNKTGKYLFWQGLTFQAGGLIAVLAGDLTTNIPVLGACLIAIGIGNVAGASYDHRCNIKNDSKGNPLSVAEEPLPQKTVG
jgi:hypothetical protein